MIKRRSARSAMLCRALLVASAAAVSACASLPATGPTGRDIERAARVATSGAEGQFPFQIVEVTNIATVPPLAVVPSSALPVRPPPPTDLIGPGDLLNITIYEAGVSLFGKGPTHLSAASSSASVPVAEDNTAVERLPAVRVDDAGFIRLPFVGRLQAGGHTAPELQSMIRNRLRGMSQDPQVMVAVNESITNSVVLAGEVNRPGRFMLRTNQETLNQTIALAGGFKGDAKDVVARVQRGPYSYEIRLSDLLDLPQRDLVVSPGDTITLISRPESFSALGAPNRAEQIRFPRGRISVAEAVALAGGPNSNAGDAAAIFVFRYVTTGEGRETPVLYHLNMMKPGALFLSQRFMMKDKDLLYVGNAAANQPTKFVQLLSQLFVPLSVVRSALP